MGASSTDAAPDAERYMLTRRDALSLVMPLAALPFATILNLGCTHGQENATRNGHRLSDDFRNNNETDTHYGELMQIPYLEIVATDVETICTLYSEIHGVTFGDADQDLGGARTARLANGGILGVRAPMHDGERPVVRPYILVEDIEAAVAAAARSGAEIIVPPMKIPNHGTCAIVFQGGIESGLWQV